MRLLHRAVIVDFRGLDAIGRDAVDFRVRDPLDVAIAHHRFEHALGIADAEAEMADVGLRGYEGDRHPIPDLATAQFGDRKHRVFIGGTIAGGALYGADDHRAGVLAE